VVIETEGLTHIHLVVSDLDRSLRFYQSAFGMEEMYRDGPHMVFLRTPGSRDTITLNAGPDERARAGVAGGVGHFGFRRKDRENLDDAIATIEAAGGRLVERGEHRPGVAFAYVTDPDGNLIEL
jgi:catechol 2,3-dioxygenase